MDPVLGVRVFPLFQLNSEVMRAKSSLVNPRLCLLEQFSQSMFVFYYQQWPTICTDPPDLILKSASPCPHEGSIWHRFEIDVLI